MAGQWWRHSNDGVNYLTACAFDCCPSVVMFPFLRQIGSVCYKKKTKKREFQQISVSVDGRCHVVFHGVDVGPA